MNLKVKKLKENAKLPTHGHSGDAGIDFYATEDVLFKAGAQARVPTGIAIEIPEGCGGFIWDKWKQGCHADYNANPCVI